MVALEGILFLITKHMLVSHLSTYLAGRSSMLLLSKVSRVGARPHDVSEATFVSSDLVQLMEQLRTLAFLPTGVVGIIGGVSMLITYLGLSGVAGIVALFLMFFANIWLQKVRWLGSWICGSNKRHSNETEGSTSCRYHPSNLVPLVS